jgi:hypothetical protein
VLSVGMAKFSTLKKTIKLISRFRCTHTTIVSKYKYCRVKRVKYACRKSMSRMQLSLKYKFHFANRGSFSDLYRSFEFFSHGERATSVGYLSGCSFLLNTNSISRIVGHCRTSIGHSNFSRMTSEQHRLFTFFTGNWRLIRHPFWRLHRK